MAEIARLEKLYKEEVIPALKKEFNYKNSMQLPKLLKISVNMGVGEALKDSKVIDHAVSDMTKITGQKPIVTKARKSIATFRLREGSPIGCKVTLRKKRMYEFLDRFVNIALPKLRDFRGFNAKSFDSSGNITIGIKEQTIFPEIDFDRIDTVRGMDITIVTSAKTAEEAKALLKGFDIPFIN